MVDEDIVALFLEKVPEEISVFVIALQTRKATTTLSGNVVVNFMRALPI